MENGQSQSRPPSLGNSKSELCPEQITFTEAGPWQSRSKLEKILIILVALFFILAVVFLVLFLVTKLSDDDDKDDKTSTIPPCSEPNDTCTTFQCLETAASIAQSIDPTVDPCDDFYEFACGEWIKRNPLTPVFPRMNNFVLIDEDVGQKMRDLLEENDPNAIEAIQRTRKYFSSCENTDAMDDRGTAPLLDLLRSGIDGDLFPTLKQDWEDMNMTFNEILSRVMEVGGLGMSPLIRFYVGADLKQSRQNIIQFSQPGLMMPSRDYYLRARNRSELMLYQQVYVDLMTHLGANLSTALEDAADMVDFEIQVANATIPKELRRDAEKLYNKMTVQQLSDRYPQFDWLSYLQGAFSPEGISITMQEEVVVNALAYYDKIFDIVNSTSRRTLLNYCLWTFVYSYSGSLDKDAREIKDKFSRARTGRQRERERWKVCKDTVQDLFPGEVGRLYVEHHFPPQAKAKVDEMITDLKEAFNEMIQEADWMSDQTKNAASEKLHVMVNQIGYPVADLNDTYLNAKHAGLNVTENEYFQNILNLRRFNLRKARRKLREPVNRDEWFYSAAIVNAFYNPLTNSIFFPAGILHKPFFSEHYPDAMNYGGIGFVIGHEMTHGFDDSGSRFDKEGNLKMWWQPEDLARFQNRTKCIMDQYSQFIEPVVKKPVNGKLTLGEDIADNGGMKEAYRAYRKLIERRGREEPKLPILSYTADQLFFINVARGWCSNMTKKLRELYLTLDYHSPMRFRVIGPMQNSEEFAKAFNCAVGSKMNPEKKCHVW